MNTGYLLAAIGIAGAITLAIRLSPFLIKGLFSDSGFLRSFGLWMPLGSMLLLMVYSAHGIGLLAPLSLPPAKLAAYTGGLVVTIVLHLWRKNALLSIAAGTAVSIAVHALA